MDYSNAVPVAPKEMTPYEQHQIAIHEWQEACRDYRRAEQRREQARCAVEQAGKDLAEHIQRNIQDPTEPQAMAEAAQLKQAQYNQVPGNGAFVGAGPSRW